MVPERWYKKLMKKKPDLPEPFMRLSMRLCEQINIFLKIQISLNLFYKLGKYFFSYKQNGEFISIINPLHEP
jgi:hypothetical protein